MSESQPQEASQGHYGLNAVIHGPSKRGKSFLGDSSPAPRVILDSEAGSRFTPSKKRIWNPQDAPPEPDGTWESAIVPIREFRDVQNVYAWLNSGRHSFKSVVLDSVSEIQQRAIDSISGVNPLKQQDWGTLLRICSDLLRKFRDLIVHPTNPLDAVLYLCMTKQRSADGVWIPYLQGSLATVLPYFCDVCAWLDFAQMEDGSVVRRLYIGPMQNHETGERVGGKLGNYIDIPEGSLDTVQRMLSLIRNGHDSRPSTDPWKSPTTSKKAAS